MLESELEIFNELATKIFQYTNIYYQLRSYGIIVYTLMVLYLKVIVNEPNPFELLALEYLV